MKYILLILVFFGCTLKGAPPENGLVIHIQPLGDISPQEVHHVLCEMKKICPNVLVNKPVSLPRSAYYAERNRYRADSLIKYLRGITPKGHVTIGLTNRDISTTKNDHHDWGVMGLGFCPGSSCVVSTYRLSKKDRLAQLFKVSIHELGHTQGLPHCAVRTCLMRDAEGKNRTNVVTGFCPKCKQHLMSRGWNL